MRICVERGWLLSTVIASALFAGVQPDYDGEAGVCFGGFGEDAADLFVADEQVVDPFYVRIDAHFC